MLKIHKKATLILMISGVMLSLFPFACNKEQVKVGISSEDLTKLPSVVTSNYQLVWEGLMLPEQTKIIIEEEQGRRSAKFIFPENIKLVLRHQDNSISLQTYGCYTCTGSCDDGCDVVKLGDEVGCTACKDDDSKTCTGKSCLSALSAKAGFIDMNAGISLIKKSEVEKVNFINSSPDWEVLSKIPEVQEALAMLNMKYYGVASPSKDSEQMERKAYLINLFGSPAVYYIPTSYFKNHPQSKVEDEYEELEGEEANNNVKCNCESGSSGCTKEAIKNLGITVGYKCKSGSCATCKMTWN